MQNRAALSCEAKATASRDGQCRSRSALLAGLIIVGRHTNGEIRVMEMPDYTSLVRGDLSSVIIHVEAQDSEALGWNDK